MEYRFDDAYGAVYDDDAGLYICSYFDAGITRQDTRTVAIRKMEKREERLALAMVSCFDELWNDQGENHEN